MSAQVIEQFGDPDVFTTKSISVPELEPGHVRIQVEASSVNPVDYKIRSGSASGIAADFPAVLHGDVAGVVDAVADDVTAFEPGDDVYACAGGVTGSGGALAEYMLADADFVASKPPSLRMREAAALPLVSITAWDGLIDRANVGEGQTVLVHGASGGVGHVGIQLAKQAGATVHTTGSSDRKLEIGRDLGADVAINYREQSVDEYVEEYTDGDGYDVVFDTVGGDNIDRSMAATALTGDVVTINARSSHNLQPMHTGGLTLHAVFMLIPLLHGFGRAHHGEILSSVAQLVEAGELEPLLDESSFGFNEVAEAHRRAESGEQIGKVTISR